MSVRVPLFEFVIEWENARRADLGRSRRMLRALREQVGTLGLDYRPRAWIVYDPAAIDPALIREALAAAAEGSRDLPFDPVLRPATGLRYYEIKNFGAGLCSCEVVVFLDSDVVPEPHWLRRLLEALAHPEVEVVGGSAYIEADSFYSSSFALFWFFPLRTNLEALVPGGAFFANNVAFRRRTFLTTPYPDLPQFRGQCVDLAQQLVERRAGLFTHPGARVSHPAPNGVKHFVLRALAHGHDDVVVACRRGDAARLHPAAILAAFAANARAAGARIAARRRQLGYGRIAALATLGLALCFLALRCLGSLLSRRNPQRFYDSIRV